MSPLVAIAALVVGFAAHGGKAIGWTTIADGAIPTRSATTTNAVLVTTRRDAVRLSGGLPAAGAAALRRVDLARRVVVAIFGDFGCSDGRVAVSSIRQRGGTLAVSLRLRPLPAGTMECLALYPTYRLLTVSRSVLSSPVPAHVTVAVARS